MAAKAKVTVALRESVLADVDADAQDAGMSRSEYVERALEDAHYRRLLDRVEAPSWTAEDEALTRRAAEWQRESLNDV